MVKNCKSLLCFFITLKNFNKDNDKLNYSD